MVIDHLGYKLKRWTFNPPPTGNPNGPETISNNGGRCASRTKGNVAKKVIEALFHTGSPYLVQRWVIRSVSTVGDEVSGLLCISSKCAVLAFGMA
jgi:hypothetical protein